MPTSDEAVLAIRHVVQEHGDKHTRLGRPAGIEGIRWFGRLLGWVWPRSYIEVLAKHDGVLVQDAILYGFLESIQVFLLLHDSWHRPAGFWPVASDGSGNFFALAFEHHGRAGEPPIVFFEMIESREQPTYWAADSYAEFVVEHMRRQCERVGCAADAR
jgi:SMI1-KNR4 cell-wall